MFQSVAGLPFLECAECKRRRGMLGGRAGNPTHWVAGALILVEEEEILVLLRPSYSRERRKACTCCHRDHLFL